MIVIASDHAGFGLKETVKTFLADRGYAIKDLGTVDPEKSVDYPDFAKRVGEAIYQGEAQQGILICGTGIGMSIAANKCPGVRAALVQDRFSAQMAREHNDANVLVLAGRIQEADEAVDLVQVWLESEFQGDRHQRRVEKIMALET